MSMDFSRLRRYDDSNYESLVDRPHTEDGGPQCLPRRTVYASPGAAAFGLVPVLDYADLRVPKADWKAVIEECHAKQIFPVYHQQNAQVMEKWNQDGFGYCWAYGLTASVMGARAAQGQSPVRLSPFSLGWLVRWKNRGFFCDEAIAGARERGIAPAEYVPEYSLKTADFKDGWEREALKYRPLEWWDTNPAEGAESMIGQCLAILATGRPLYVAYNWWGHALQVVGMNWNEASANNIDWLNWNSHGDGVIVLAGSKALPDEAYGVREVTIAS